MTRNMLLPAAVFMSALVAFGGSPQQSQPARQATFESPESAVDALAAAVCSRDRNQLEIVLGPRLRELSSGNTQQDDVDLQRLWAALQRGYRFEDAAAGAKSLLIGPDSWRFPAPLVAENNLWRFDTDTAVEEVIDRRVGRNELDAIATSHYYVAAQELYRQMNPTRSSVPTYAARIASTPGQRDGLYWPAGPEDLQSPLGPLVSAAIERGELKQPATGGVRRPYRGYFYKVLTRQGPDAPGGQKDYIGADGKMTGGFALLAWPAEYGRSGVMSFMVSKDNVVYQADLGKETQQAAEAITAFNPDSKWEPAEQPKITPAKSDS